MMMKNKLLNDGSQKTFALILDAGDEVMKSITGFAKDKNLKAAQFTAIGALSRVTLGYFDFSIKDYHKIFIEAQVEVINITGDISIYNDEPKVHAHIVVGKQDGSAHGGHLLEGTVHPTLEIILTESPAYLQREVDESSGIPLIKL